MFLRLLRFRQVVTEAGIVGRRDNRPVCYPEIIPWMRSGPYHFAASSEHEGQRVDRRHYVVTCWEGSHNLVALFSLIYIGLYVPRATIDPFGKSEKPELDVRYKPLFMKALQAAKLFLAQCPNTVLVKGTEHLQ